MYWNSGLFLQERQLCGFSFGPISDRYLFSNDLFTETTQTRKATIDLLPEQKLSKFKNQVNVMCSIPATRVMTRERCPNATSANTAPPARAYGARLNLLSRSRRLLLV